MKFKRPMLNFEDYLVEKLQDPENAQCFLMVSLEEYSETQNLDSLLSSLRYIAAAKGGILEFAQHSTLDTLPLEQAAKRNTKLEWERVLDALGITFSPLAIRTQPVF